MFYSILGSVMHFLFQKALHFLWLLSCCNRDILLAHQKMSTDHLVIRLRHNTQQQKDPPILFYLLSFLILQYLYVSMPCFEFLIHNFTSVGGQSSLADYCTYFVAYSDGSCTDVNSARAPDRMLGEVRGSNSR